MKKIRAAKHDKTPDVDEKTASQDTQYDEITFSTPKASEMTATVPLQNNFYRDHYKTLLITLFLCIAGTVIVLGIILHIVLSRPDPIHFSAVFNEEKNLPPAISQFGIVPQTPIDLPNMSEGELSQWLVNAIVRSFSLNSQEYNAEIANSQQFYSETAWHDYVNLINNMVRFDTLTNRQALVSVLSPVGAPIIDNQGVSQGRYLWIFKLPVIVRFYGNQNLPSQTMDLTVIVGRTSMADDVYGIKIGAISAENIRQVRNYNGP